MCCTESAGKVPQQTEEFLALITNLKWEYLVRYSGDVIGDKIFRTFGAYVILSLKIMNEIFSILNHSEFNICHLTSLSCLKRLIGYC